MQLEGETGQYGTCDVGEDDNDKDRQVMIELTSTTKKWLAKKGYDEKFGARPLSRVIQDQIKKPLAEELLFGKLTKGGLVTIKMEGGIIKFDFQMTL